MLFDNLKSAAELALEPTEGKPLTESPTVEEEKKDLPEAPKEEAKEEEAKEEEKEAEIPEEFHKHSRFKELIEQKNEWKSKYEDLEKQLSSKPKEEVVVPEFEDVGELKNFLAELPKKIKEEVVQEITQAKEAEVTAQKEADEYVTEMLQQIKAQDKSLDEKAFVQFCLKHEFEDVEKAYEVYKDIQEAKTAKLKEDIQERKASSGLKSGSNGSAEEKIGYRPRQSLDDVIAEAKSRLKGI